MESKFKIIYFIIEIYMNAPLQSGKLPSDTTHAHVVVAHTHIYSDSNYLVLAYLDGSPEAVVRKEGSWQLHHQRSCPFPPPPYTEASKFTFLCQQISNL